MAIFPGAGESGGADEPRGAATSVSFVAPRNPHEEAIVAIWRDVLGRPDIGVLDDFFDLDGDSLRAIQMIGRVRKLCGVNIGAVDFFESPTVAALASAVATPSGQPVVSRRPPGADPVLSFDQRRLWLENQLRPAAAYNVHVRQRLVGHLNVTALDSSIRAILARHEALRTRFPTVDGGPVQIVDDPDQDWHLTLVDLAGVPDGRTAAVQLADDQAAAPFDLARGPLFRCLLVRLADSEHVLSVTAHHIVCDDWSVGLFVRELTALYGVDGEVDRAGLPALPVQYRDYAVWQQRWLTGEALEQQVDYWRRHLVGAPPALALPTSAWRAASQRAGGGLVRTTLCAGETAALHKLSRAYGVTPFITLLASLATVLSRWSGQQDVVIGVPIAGRSDGGTENLIGFFVNTLPVRVDLSGAPTFADLLDRVRQAALGGYAHADAPLDVLVQELRAPRVPGRTPLFQVILNGVDIPGAQTLSGVSAERMDAPTPPSKFDLTLTGREVDGLFRLDLEFDAGRYQDAMIRILLGHVVALLRAATDDPGRGIFEYLLQTDRQPATTQDPPADRPLPAPHLAVERLARLPDRVALVDANGIWSYRRLNGAADRVARALTERGLSRPGQHLAVVSGSTAEFVAVVLGCMKAGATFSVIDAAVDLPAYSGVSAVLACGPAGEIPDGTMDFRPILHDDVDQVPGGPDDAIGSAAPAGDWATERYDLRGTDRFAVLSSLPNYLMSALASTFTSGAALVLPQRGLAGDPDGLLSWLHDNSVSVAYLSPPLLRAMAARAPERQLPALRYVFVENAGETLCHDIEAVRRLSAACRCVALYHVDRTGRPLAAYLVPDDWEPEAAPLRVPLGSELPGASARLRHPAGEPAATGEVGEICFGEFRTGDLGRHWSDGTLEFVAALDVDPSHDPLQTAGTLRDLPRVHDALVTEYRTADGRIVLVGYVAGHGPALDAAGIRQQLVNQLPDHLVPQHLFLLDSLPLTAEGDYDLAALPKPDADSTPLDRYVAPRTPIEGQLTEILGDLLDVDRIGVYDSFFELGGFSLLAAQLNSRIREKFRVELTLRDTFSSATVEALAQLIVQAQVELADAAEIEALLDELDSVPDGQG
ncbi:MAG: condensation domain-containing protein [Streptosporangiaceae bacterium]